MDNDSSAIQAQGDAIPVSRWLLLIHQIPPKPDYFRVKVSRRLRRIGARALKNSVYVLPKSDEALEDFQWLLGEIVAEGGEAMLCEAEFLAGVSNQELSAMFHTPSPGGEPSVPPERAALVPGRTWVTRQGVKVDRMASAWLIRRFIDPEAQFKFVPPHDFRPAPGELRFDMFEAEYGHEGGTCSFETLRARFGLRQPALQPIAEIVHDIDCKDEKFGRPETAGVALLLDGLVRAHAEDAVRLERAAALFDDLHAHFESVR